MSCTVEVWRTEVVKNHFKVKNVIIFDFSKTVAKMLFLSVSRESIGILTIFRKTFFAQLLLVADRLILRSKMVENYENQ